MAGSSGVSSATDLPSSGTSGIRNTRLVGGSMLYLSACFPDWPKVRSMADGRLPVAKGKWSWSSDGNLRKPTKRAMCLV